MHIDPHLIIKDKENLNRFFKLFNINISQEQNSPLLPQICYAFTKIPYENLTKIIKNSSIISTANAKRLPDEVISDYLEYGTGGTCFSLAATFIAILDAIGFEVYPILADRHYGNDTHCAIIFTHDSNFLLLDPGYLINTPTPIPTTQPTSFSTDFNEIELVPHLAGQKVDLVTIVKKNRSRRLTYKINPVDGQTFAKAWGRSFTWEMMTYPVLTCLNNGNHHYLQGKILRIKNKEHSNKKNLSIIEQVDYITKTVGINKKIVQQAFSVVSNG